MIPPSLVAAHRNPRRIPRVNASASPPALRGEIGSGVRGQRTRKNFTIRRGILGPPHLWPSPPRKAGAAGDRSSTLANLSGSRSKARMPAARSRTALTPRPISNPRSDDINCGPTKAPRLAIALMRAMPPADASSPRVAVASDQNGPQIDSVPAEASVRPMKLSDRDAAHACSDRTRRQPRRRLRRYASAVRRCGRCSHRRRRWRAA